MKRSSMTSKQSAAFASGNTYQSRARRMLTFQPGKALLLPWHRERCRHDLRTSEGMKRSSMTSEQIAAADLAR